jgi:Predicted transcription factor, homolog of eukaryotic MBF1
MFSVRLKELREDRKISQKQLAEMLSVSQQTVAKWETAKATPNPQTVVKLANVFDVSADYLLGNAAEKPYEPTNDDIKFALFHGADDITDEMYEEVKRYAEYIKTRTKDKHE